MLIDKMKNMVNGSSKNHFNDITRRNTYHKIKTLFEQVISDYLEMLKKYSFKVYEITEYQKVIVFQCGHITYFGIEVEQEPIQNCSELFFYYDQNKEYYNLCNEYTIVFQNLILNYDFDFQERIFMERYKGWKILFKYNELNPECDEQDLKSEDFKLFNYVNEKLPELDLKKRYFEHKKEYGTIEKNKSFSIGLKHFKSILDYFENDYLKNFSYNIMNISKYELLIIVEKNYFFSFYMCGELECLYDRNQMKAYSLENLKDIRENEKKYAAHHYKYIIQELNYNSLFKFNYSKFNREHHDTLLQYISFDYEKYKNDYIGINNSKVNKFKEYDKKFPDLRLQERFDLWEGKQYYFIVYELNVGKIKGLGVSRTTDSFPMSTARTLLHEYEHFQPRSYNAFSFNDNWFKCMDILLNEAKKCSWKNVKRTSNDKSLLAEKVEYYVVPLMLKNTSLRNILDCQQEVLLNAEKELYKNYEKSTYDITEYKWKSEELVLECVKKVFKKKQVVHQYRPFYLHSKTGGQLSYDVFVYGLDIAFEYQGKQHFEPIEIFGGQENFEKQKERDKIKKELSEENGITLIYINYWEDISVELIKEKLKENNINYK